MVAPDLRKMRQLAGRIDDLAKVPARVARPAADRINVLLEEQFEQGVNAYGKPWAELAERTLQKHGEPPLQGEFGERPGDMASGTNARPASGAGIILTVPFPGSIHQTGAQKGNWKMPRRAVLPDESVLPAAWRDAIAQATNETIRNSTKR